jgi:glucose-1-phosphate adenylyltransferase
MRRVVNMGGTIVFILAGGEGSRLRPLTDCRSKPAVPFGGSWRLIDFPLSNCLNSNLKQVYLLTQYKSESLTRHVYDTWGFLRPQLGESINILPPQLRQTQEFYRGTTDALYQNKYTIQRECPRDVMILSGDHIYAMDYRPFLARHHESDADLTIATYPVSRDEASRFGILCGDHQGRITCFKEKPVDVPAGFADAEGNYNASMGVYIFKSSVLLRELEEGPAMGRRFDFGRDIIPGMIDRDRVFLYPFTKSPGGKRSYWRDVGTLDSYYEATLNLLGPSPAFDLFNQAWPMFHEATRNGPASVGTGGPGFIRNSIISPGCRINGNVSNSVISPNVRVAAGAKVSNSILLEGTVVESDAVVHGSIVDKHVWIQRGCTIGLEPRSPSGLSASKIQYTPAGISVISKGEVIQRETLPGKRKRREVMYYDDEVYEKAFEPRKEAVKDVAVK